MWVTFGLTMISIGSYMIIMRGMPTGPQMFLMSNITPARPLARLSSNTFWYSAVSGGCWPRPPGLVGSHTPTGLPRFHKPSQSGYFLASSARTPAKVTNIRAATAPARARLR